MVSEPPESQIPEPMIPLLELIGVEFPPKHVADFLLDTYLESVHWFMVVFHEPSLRVDYEKIMHAKAAPKRKLGLVVLLMVILLSTLLLCLHLRLHKLMLDFSLPYLPVVITC